MHALQLKERMHDYLIVGNGLAGSVLSYRLSEAGKSLIIVDKDNPNAAWKVAGGVWNAITFRKILKGWNADDLLSEAQQFYPSLEKKWELNFYEKKEIVKAFSDVHFQNTWLSKSEEPEFSNYLSDAIPDEIKDLPLSLPFGAGTVKNGGYVNLQVFIPYLRQKLKKAHDYLEEDFDYNQLLITDEGFSYKSFQARNIIFCDRTQARS